MAALRHIPRVQLALYFFVVYQLSAIALRHTGGAVGTPELTAPRAKSK